MPKVCLRANSLNVHAKTIRHDFPQRIPHGVNIPGPAVSSETRIRSLDSVVNQTSNLKTDRDVQRGKLEGQLL